MENSGNILFQDDAQQWYVAVPDGWIGPLKAADIYEKIQRHEVTLAHYVWKKGLPEWKRICDVRAFQAAAPHQPDKALQKQVQQHRHEAASQSADMKVWYLYYHDSQYGPFSLEEVRSFLKSGKIHGRVFGWCQGMKGWERLETLSAFAQKAEAKKPEIRKAEVKKPEKSKRVHQRVDLEASDNRVNPRRPLLAKIIMADEQSVIVGVCRDISVGGLQVLAETVPGRVGARLKMNISPSSNEAGNRIEPFTAEGVIVRILEDGRGFSFRFDRLSDRSRQAIESYIESPV